MKTVNDLLKKSGDSCFVAKKGKKFIAMHNGELSLTINARSALASHDKDELQKLLLNLSIDDRNAKVLGRSFDTLALSVK